MTKRRPRAVSDILTAMRSSTTVRKMDDLTARREAERTRAAQLAAEQTQRRLAADRAERNAQIERRIVRRLIQPDRDRHRLSLVADAMINTLDDPSEIEPMRPLTTPTRGA